MTSNPHDFTPRLAHAFADLPKLTSSFHLPVQSGSDRILGRMNRQYCREEYLERVGWIRDARADVSFSSDIIVGFPGETEEDFEDTLSLIERMRYSFVYAYKYSKRAGAPAERLTDVLPESVLDQRLQRLLALQDRITSERNRSVIGLDARSSCSAKTPSWKTRGMAAPIKADLHGFTLRGIFLARS